MRILQHLKTRRVLIVLILIKVLFINILITMIITIILIIMMMMVTMRNYIAVAVLFFGMVLLRRAAC